MFSISSAGNCHIKFCEYIVPMGMMLSNIIPSRKVLHFHESRREKKFSVSSSLWRNLKVFYDCSAFQESTEGYFQERNITV